MTSFLTEEEIEEMGFGNIGKNAKISRKASFYNVENISIGDNVRIDDFCVLSGSIEIGNYVHISAYTALYGKHGIKIGNYAGISPRCTVFSATDDFSGEYMVGPLVPEEFTHVVGGLVTISDFVQIGANSIIMPSVTVSTGAAIGAFSLVNKDTRQWAIYYGIPAKFFKERNKKLLTYAELI